MTQDDTSLPPMPASPLGVPPKDGEIARPSEGARPATVPPSKPIEKKPLDWKPVEIPKNPKLAYSGNSREFKFGIKNELRKDFGTRLSVSDRAETTKLFGQRGGKYLGTRKERNDIKKLAEKQGWSRQKTLKVLKEAKKLKGEMGGK